MDIFGRTTSISDKNVNRGKSDKNTCRLRTNYLLFWQFLTILQTWSLLYGATTSSSTSWRRPICPISDLPPPSQSSPSLFSDQCPAAECRVSPLRSHYHQQQQRPCSGEQVTSIISSVPSVECSPAPAHNVSTSQPSPGQRNCYNCEPQPGQLHRAPRRHPTTISEMEQLPNI